MFLRNSLTLCGSILSCLCHCVLNLLKVTTDCKMFFSISGFWVNVESHLLGLLGFYHHVLMWSIALEKGDKNAKIQKINCKFLRLLEVAFQHRRKDVNVKMETHLLNQLWRTKNWTCVTALYASHYQLNWKDNYSLPKLMRFPQTSLHVLNLPICAFLGQLLILFSVNNLCVFHVLLQQQQKDLLCFKMSRNTQFELGCMKERGYTYKDAACHQNYLMTSTKFALNAIWWFHQ